MDRYKFVDDLWDEMEKRVDERKREVLSCDELAEVVLSDLISATHTTLDKHGVPEEPPKTCPKGDGSEPGYTLAN